MAHLNIRMTTFGYKPLNTEYFLEIRDGFTWKNADYNWIYTDNVNICIIYDFSSFSNP